MASASIHAGKLSGVRFLFFRMEKLPIVSIISLWLSCSLSKIECGKESHAFGESCLSPSLPLPLSLSFCSGQALRASIRRAGAGRCARRGSNHHWASAGPGRHAWLASICRSVSIWLASICRIKIPGFNFLIRKGQLANLHGAVLATVWSCIIMPVILQFIILSYPICLLPIC